VKNGSEFGYDYIPGQMTNSFAHSLVACLDAAINSLSGNSFDLSALHQDASTAGYLHYRMI
jgi:hypothetical protein